MTHSRPSCLVRLALAIVCTASVLVVAPTASADDHAPGADAPQRLRPRLRLGTLDLLPFDDATQTRFNKEHPALLYRAQSYARQVRRVRTQLAALNGKKGKKGKAAVKRPALLKEQKRLGVVTAALLARLSDEVEAYGVDGALVAYMNHAPTGPGRAERYSHGLVLLLADLTPEQRARFEQVVTQVDGAYHAITAQKERTLLALKQSELDKDQLRGITQTFARQLRVIDQRFWQLVDYTLTRDQKVWIWNRIPRTRKRKSQPTEHLYAINGLSPSQGTRLRALLTEIEHEAAPDRAGVKRLQAALNAKDRKLSGAERKALAAERTVAYKRLGALTAFRRRETLAILSAEQWLDYLAIPPGVSINDRAGNYRRVLGDWKPSASQQAKIAALNTRARVERRATQKRMAELRREGVDYGPDSPQMMSMQMAMTGAKADQAATNRALIGAVFSEVMSSEELGRWVLGMWGYKR